MKLNPDLRFAPVFAELLLLLFAGALPAQAACAEYGGGVAFGTVTLKSLTEASGIVASRRNPGVLWTHNDGSRQDLYALGTNAARLATFDFNKSVDDTEDLAIGPGPVNGVSYLYVGDIGGNSFPLGGRSSVKIVRIPEPLVDLAWAADPRSPNFDGVETFTLVYPDGSYDAESLMVDPLSGDMLIATKQDAGARLYRANMTTLTNKSTVTMQFVRTVPFNLASGGDISADGTQIVLRREDFAMSWVRTTNQTVGAALAAAGVSIPVIGPPDEPNGEAIALLPDGTGYVTIGEGGDPVLYVFKAQCPSAPAPLPAWAQGTFNGYVEGCGLSTMTITAAGKVAGKIAMAGTNYTFSAASYAAGGGPINGFTFAAVAKAGKASLPLTLTITQAAAPQTLGVATGTLGGVSLALCRDVWKTESAMLTSYVGYCTATLPGTAEYGSGYLALTVDKAGKAKAAGKLADGTAVSLSGTLILDGIGRVFAVVYTAPATYKGGDLFGLAEFVAPVGEGAKVVLRPLDRVPFQWRSRNPQATETYGDGFARETELVGGGYGKTENLYDYYHNKNLVIGSNEEAPVPEIIMGVTREPSDWWETDGIALTVVTNKLGVMTALAAPKASVPVDPEKDGSWDYGSTNSVGLKIALTRATGIFKGTFKAWFDYPDRKHISKSLAFEGALTPEREDRDDGVAGRGFFLWADKAVPPLPARPYAFKWSYDFKVQLSE